MSALAFPVPAQSQPEATEDLLLDIWKRSLRIPEIDRDSNFFDLGGDSLLAVNLLLEVERQTGVSIPITAIYDAPTVAEMARLIANETAPESACVVLLKPGMSGSPLFIVHGIGGTVMELAALGRKIGIPQAVYAIQARGLDGRDVPLATVEEMADSYLAAIRCAQPRGPYRLCGYSFGGLVAMEIARRLEAGNEKIAALILVDAYAHPSTWPVLSRTKMRLRRTVHLLLKAIQGSPAQTFSRVIKRARALLAGIGAPAATDSAARESARLHDWLLDQNPSLPLPLLRTREAGSAALRAYRPQSYAGPIIFLKAKQRDAEFPDDPERIWRALATSIVYRTIPGGHRTVVTEYAGAAAATLTACLSWAPREEGSPGKAGVPSSIDIAGAFRSQTV